MSDEISISLRKEEWDTVVRALSMLLLAGLPVDNGTSPFAILDHIYDEISKGRRTA